MGSAFSGLNGFEIFFLLCAIVGGIFLLIRVVMQFTGLDAEADLDADLAGGHVDSDVSFKLLSVQSLSAFLLMFGLVGFALYHQSGTGFGLSILGGSLAGLAAVWVIGKLFLFAIRLQSSGTVSNERAVGCEGSVYLSIPAGGTGRVTISLGQRLREFEAVTADGAAIPTGEPVRVVQVAGRTLVVERIARPAVS